MHLRYATEADFAGFVELPLPYRVRAFAAVEGERVLGVGGLAYLPDGTVGAFVHADDEARKHRIAAHKAGLRAMAEAEALGLKCVVAMASEEVEAAERWLLRLGFAPEVHNDATVYVWRKGGALNG